MATLKKIDPLADAKAKAATAIISAKKQKKKSDKNSYDLAKAKFAKMSHKLSKKMITQEASPKKAKTRKKVAEGLKKAKGATKKPMAIKAPKKANVAKVATKVASKKK
jgi:hypothetical protein